jgi:dCMP deaminase
MCDIELTSLANSKESKWDLRFLNLASHISTWSKDPSTKVGSVIVNEKNHILSVGYNGFPSGVEDNDSRYLDRDTKLKFVCHAERNALDNAHSDVSDCTLYATLMPCNECAKSIIQRGIKRVVCYVPESFDGTRFNWEVTTSMFEEAGIKLDILTPV